MKRLQLLSVLALLSLLLGLMAGPLGVQGQNLSLPRRVPAAAHDLVLGSVESYINQPTWHIGPYPPQEFQYVRHDGVFVPGPDGTPWANRVYFLGGRTSPPSESPNIWVFDPVTGVFTDTQADVIEDVSNYNGNLILDDCTGRGPAIYVIGGTNKDGGGVNIGMVQRYYPQSNTAESVPTDQWPGMINGYYVAAMGTAVVDDYIYAYGGWQTDTEPYFSAETWRFDPCALAGMRWTNLGTPMSAPRSYIMSAMQNGKIYAMGGIDAYIAGDLVPTDLVEVLDTANLAAGWQTLAPMPVAIAEGRGYGLGSDTLGPFFGYIYTAGGGDWPLPGTEAMRYDIANNTWDQSFPDLIQGVADNAGTYVPLYTPDPTDGLPGLWTFGGRINESCDPPLGQTEYYPLQTTEQCNILLVDDDWDQYSGQPFQGGSGYYYTETLQALGYSYDRWDAWTQGSPSLADLENYNAVIWFTGYAWEGTVTATNEADLAAYLEGGGNLLLSAEDYLYEMDVTPFGATYLGIDTFVSDVGEVDVTGTAGDPLGDGLGPYTLTVPTSWPPDDPVLYTDYVTPATGVSNPFYYTASGVANSTDRDALNWRTAFMAWPIEGLANLDDRMDVLGRALDWFCYSRPAELLLLPEGQSGGGAAGTEVTYTLSLVNNITFEDTFALEYSAAWPITGPVLLGPLGSGEIEDFVVTVTVPADAECGAMDQAVVSAAAVSSPRYSDTATITTTAEVPGLGDLAGTVYDLNTGLGISNAHVYLLSSGSPYTETWADATGAYTITGLPACSYEGGADAVRYYSTTFSITLQPGLVTPLDLYLAASWPMLSESAVSVTLPEGGATAYTVTLSNVGSGDLLFTIAETPTDTVWLSFGPLQGTLAPSESLPIVLGLDTTGLAPDACYNSSLYIQFNDPYVLESSLPVQLCVERVEPPCVPPDSFDFSWLPFTLTVGDQVTLTAAIVGTPTLPLTLTWDFGDGGAPVVGAGLVVTHIYTASGTFTVTLMVQNPCFNGTLGYALTVEEEVVPPSEFRVYLPIVFKN